MWICQIPQKKIFPSNYLIGLPAVPPPPLGGRGGRAAPPAAGGPGGRPRRLNECRHVCLRAARFLAGSCGGNCLFVYCSRALAPRRGPLWKDMLVYLSNAARDSPRAASASAGWRPRVGRAALHPAPETPQILQKTTKIRGFGGNMGGNPGGIQVFCGSVRFPKRRFSLLIIL